MTKPEFLLRLQEAGNRALKFAESYVLTELKPSFKYDVELLPLSHGSDTSQPQNNPQDKVRMELGLTDKEVVDLLYREGKIPIWININVLKSGTTETTLSLTCTGLYSDDESKYYYNEKHGGPFGIKSPVLPIGYKDGDTFEL
ncbi:MAG: hypothetical protein QNK23_08640 [Crocinitomicaceae bacterium]|nr:hypothetical protein [Crocinitomicaceae bacterium]